METHHIDALYEPLTDEEKRELLRAVRYFDVHGPHPVMSSAANKLEAQLHLSVTGYRIYEGPPGDLTASISGEVAADEEMPDARFEGVRGVACSTCGAEPGEPCFNPDGFHDPQFSHHKPRIDAYAASGDDVPRPARAILFGSEAELRAVETQVIRDADLVGVERPDGDVNVIKHREGHNGVFSRPEWDALVVEVAVERRKRRHTHLAQGLC